MIEALISIIAPHYCINCHALGGKLCDNCKNNIIITPLSHCLECHGILINNICRVCNLPYDFIVSCSEREGILQKLIDDFKFNGGRTAAIPLSDLLVQQLPYFPGKTVVTHVPTARAHIRERGYDHARLLAKAIAKSRDFKCQSLLIRRKTARQVGADRKTRLRQAKDLYICRKNLSPETTYVLVDDIITTGATVHYAAEALRSAGATKIAVLTLAYQSGN